MTAGPTGDQRVPAAGGEAIVVDPTRVVIYADLIRKALVMIELTDDQLRALSEPSAHPTRVLNPRTREAFVLLRLDEYERLTDDAYDDSPWTRDELNAVAVATADRVGWDADDGTASPEIR